MTLWSVFHKRCINATSKRLFSVGSGRAGYGTGNQPWRKYNRVKPALRLKENILPHIEKPIAEFHPPILRHHAINRRHPAPTLRALDEGDPTPDKFCIFAPWFYNNIQWKCMEGDRLMLPHLCCPDTLRVYSLDEDVVFKNVMLVANRDKSLIGRPIIPFAKVICRVEQVCQLPRVRWTRKFRRDRRVRTRGHRKWVTIVKVKKIECDLDMWENMPYDDEYRMWEASLNAREQALVNEEIKLEQRFCVDPRLLTVPNFEPDSDILDDDLHTIVQTSEEVEDLSNVA